MPKMVDPVCGMQLDPGQVEAESRYQGKAYHFCSEECKRLFDENPKEYAGTSASTDDQPPAGTG
jgi:YHS domain-containing protein